MDAWAGIREGALWFRLLWLGVIQAGCVVVMVLLIRIIAEIHREDKQKECQNEERDSKADNPLGLFVGHDANAGQNGGESNDGTLQGRCGRMFFGPMQLFKRDSSGAVRSPAIFLRIS